MSTELLQTEPSGWKSSRFIEGRTTPKNEELLKELAREIGGASWYSPSGIVEGLKELVRGNRHSKSRTALASLTGLAAIVEAGCASGQLGQGIVYPSNAPRIISGYGDSWNAGSQLRKVPHNGIDIEGNIGDSVLAAADGVVFRSHWSVEAGWRIIIEHGRDADGNYLRTVYIHNNKNLVKEGDKVKRGQMIAELGRTGSGLTSGIAHLHFGVYTGPTKEYSNKWGDVNPHNYWVGGPSKITCFEPGKDYQKVPIRFTYPVECKK